MIVLSQGRHTVIEKNQERQGEGRDDRVAGGGLGGRALGDHRVRQRDSRCHGPSRACPRPERLSREQETWVREGTVAAGKHLAIYSEGGAMEG